MNFIGPDRLGFSTGWEAISNAEPRLRHRQWPAFDRGRYGPGREQGMAGRDGEAATGLRAGAQAHRCGRIIDRDRRTLRGVGQDGTRDRAFAAENDIGGFELARKSRGGRERQSDDGPRRAHRAPANRCRRDRPETIGGRSMAECLAWAPVSEKDMRPRPVASAAARRLPAPVSHRTYDLADRVGHELRLFLVYFVVCVRDVLRVWHELGEPTPVPVSGRRR
jgi:hypothetical protein